MQTTHNFTFLSLPQTLMWTLVYARMHYNRLGVHRIQNFWIRARSGSRPDPNALDPAGSWSSMILALPYVPYGNIFKGKRARLLPKTGIKLLFLHHNLKHLDWLSVWILVKSFTTSTSCRCWQFVYDNDYSILCSSGVQKLLTDIVCHQQLNIHSVAFLC